MLFRSEPTCRAEDGLALSSRNVYLNPTERVQAAQLSTQLRQIAEALRSGATDTSTLEAQATQTLNDQGWKVDYVTVRRRMDLLPPAPGEALAGACVVLAAARMGQTRLIDNLTCVITGTDATVDLGVVSAAARVGGTERPCDA